MKRTIVLAVAAATLAVAPLAFGDDSTLGVTVGPEASFTTVDATTTLSKGDTTFLAFTGTTNFTYKIRTSVSTGTGSITVAVTAFSGSGAPLVADLSYTCTSPTSGTACASSTGASTSATSVVTFGADAHSADAGDSGTAAWTLTDKTNVKTGSHSSTATFTISAT